MPSRTSNKSRTSFVPPNLTTNTFYNKKHTWTKPANTQSQ